MSVQLLRFPQNPLTSPANSSPNGNIQPHEVTQTPTIQMQASPINSSPVINIQRLYAIIQTPTIQVQASPVTQTPITNPPNREPASRTRTVSAISHPMIGRFPMPLPLLARQDSGNHPLLSPLGRPTAPSTRDESPRFPT